MEWLATLLQAGLKTYMSAQLGAQMMQKQTQKAKDIAIFSSFVGFGSLVFLVFSLASIVMVFVDLGNQFESHNGVHFSGMMLSAIYLITFGIIVFAICYGCAKYFSAKEKIKEVEAEAAKPHDPYAPLIAFGEQFLVQLLEKLSQPKAPASPAAASQPSATPAPHES